MNTLKIRKKYPVFLLLFFFFCQLSAMGFTVEKLRVNNLTNPLGIDTHHPIFSWQMHSDTRNESQVAYRILVSSSVENINANIGDVWDSNRIESSQSNNIAYQGQPLASRTDYYWKVCVWNQDNNNGVWSKGASFGTSLLSENEWSANWIVGADQKIDYPAVEILFDEPILARYVALLVEEIGIPVDEGGKWRVQLSEMEVYGPHDPKKNIALKCPVKISNEFKYQNWDASKLTDGIRYSSSSSSGGTSGLYNTSTPDSPVKIEIDLLSEMMVDKIVLYPRTDISARDNKKLAGNFPKDIKVETRTTMTDMYYIRAETKNIPAPEVPFEIIYDRRLPMFGKSIEINKTVKTAKIYASGLGLFEISVNGEIVTQNVLEPGESSFDKTVLYATYDITDKLSNGKNSLVTRMGNGMYNNPYIDGRYQKLNVSYGPVRFIAQIEITYTDGTKEIIVTDESWKTAKSPLKLSSWYGGEEYDANLEINGINTAAFNFENWDSAGLYTYESGTLKAQFYEPTAATESWKAISVTNPENGIYVVDFGRNFAGQYEFSLKADAGVTIQMYPSEILYPSGRINQSIIYPSYNTYTFRGAANGETWGPKFVYHGMRYLEIIGLPFEPTPDMFTAKLIRAANEKTGSFHTSNDLLNGIETIITRAIESNLYNTLTDCPHREKLGWLEVPNLMFNSISAVYNMSAWMPKITMDIKDSQLESGMVPTTAPEFTIFGSPFRDEPTWSAATITVPWQSYLTYGDTVQIQEAYPQMEKLMDYFESRSNNYLLNFGLGDWGHYDGSTSVGFTVSCTYYHLALTMAQISQKLNRTDKQQKYANLADNIKKSLNSTYFKSATNNYDSGSQASNAMALYYGIVADANRDAVLQNLITSVEKADYHITTGEIALKPLFMTLAENGRNDIVYKMATQRTMPSYGYFIEKGMTTLPEYWDMQGSLNHCMMGHIEGWFYEYLAGIKNDGVAFKEIKIEPYFTSELTEVDVSTQSLYGKIRSSWSVTSDSKINVEIEIPANSTATIHLPLKDITKIKESGNSLSVGDGILSFGHENDSIKINVGSGKYNFTLFETPSSL